MHFRLALFLTAAVLVSSARTYAEPKKVVEIEGISEYRLDNGLQILLYPDNSRPTVTVNLTILVGSRHEGYGETGMAHLLEHMLFKGTPTHPNVPKVLADRGARFNGTTWVDRTNYYETMAASDDNLEFALRLEADRMMNSYVRRDDLLSEMTVVRNEFEMGENSPSSILRQRMMAVAFEWHNYGKSTIGNRSDIERVPIDKLKAFYKKYYRPDNAMVTVAGKFDPETALKYIEKYFGKLENPTAELPNTYTEEPPQDGERSVTLRRVGDVGAVGLVYHVPEGSHPDIAAMDVLTSILTRVPTGRLYKALVETKKATSIRGGAYSWHDPAVFSLMAMVPKDGSLDEVRDIMVKIVEGVGQSEITEEEVSRGQQEILKQREMAAANTSRIAVELSEWAAQGDWRLYFLYRDWVEKVTVADVRRVAGAYLKRSNRTVGMYVPTKEPSSVEIPPAKDLAEVLKDYKGREAIAQGEDFDVSPANIEQRTTRTDLPLGVKAALLPKRTRGETVDLDLTLRYGSKDTLRGYETAADFLPALMRRGTEKLTRQQIQDALDEKRATISASGGLGEVNFSIKAKRGTLSSVLQILGQILREPSFPAEEFEILKQQQVTRLDRQKTDPQSRGITLVRRTVSPYPKDDVRYIPTIDEEIDRVKGVTLESVKELYAKFLGSSVGELSIVGDFDAEASTQVLASFFSGWNSDEPYARIPVIAFTDVKGSTHEINLPDKKNAVYLVGLVFPLKNDDPDYPAMVLGNYIFGGGSLSSRLGDRVRQEEGLSYGVGSFLSVESLDPRASLTIYAITNPANINKVDKAVREELDKLLADGVTKDELKRAKEGWLKKQEVARSSDANLAGTLNNTLYTGRTMAYYQELEEKIQQTSAAEVLKAMRQYIDPKRLVVVKSGDFANLGQPAGN